MGPDIETVRVLLVEDDAMSRELWTLLLEGEGYQVRASESGETALAQLSDCWQPHVVLMDLQMPGLSGAALASALRSASGKNHTASGKNHTASGKNQTASGKDQTTSSETKTPGRKATTPTSVIVLAMSGSEPRGATTLAGFDGFLLKPFTIEALERVITASFQRAFTPQNPMPTHAAPLAATSSITKTTPPAATISPDRTRLSAHEPTPSILDSAVYDRLAASMPSGTLCTLYELCLRDARTRIEAMRLAAIALDDATYRRQAHAIKGGCGMVGAQFLAALASTMEADGLSSAAVTIATQVESLERACDHLEGMLRAKIRNP